MNCFLDTGFEIKELLTTGLIDYEMKDYYKSNYEDSEARELLKKHMEMMIMIVEI